MKLILKKWTCTGLHDERSAERFAHGRPLGLLDAGNLPQVMRHGYVIHKPVFLRVGDVLELGSEKAVYRVQHIAMGEVWVKRLNAWLGDRRASVINF